jgi:hypothetical protein
MEYLVKNKIYHSAWISLMVLFAVSMSFSQTPAAKQARVFDEKDREFAFEVP